MAGTVDPGRWTGRLAELIAEHEVPGASLAFLYEGEVHTAAAGVVNADTGAPVLTDSLFQIGSVTKVWTATQLMMLAEQGALTLDTPVHEVLPEFRVADAEVTKAVTVRHLLTHTSGIDGDLFLDTGRGDDCLEKYVQACADLRQNHPLGATQSYCNSGFTVAGRIVEWLTGKGWDAALREQIVEPLGLTHTWTLPEDVLRFSAAVGHMDGKVVPAWGLMRSAGPAGLICARPADVVAFARAHLAPGLLRDPEAMRVPQVDIPNPHTLGRQWGIGWILDEWDGHRVFSHGGNTIGQAAMLWVVDDTVACVTANGGHTAAFQHAVASELFGELLGVTPPPVLGPPQTPVEVDVERYAGVYERAGARITLAAADGRLNLHMEATGALAGLQPPMDFELIPVNETTFVGRPENEPQWISAVFYELADGSPYVHMGARATPKVG
ncbi:CubicO group peptidase (beta-lactamase class C family) [Thermocatellispora tengchongensis]|uniref:CubicO group peptidase (Beta-lactamase class C family) n=1 Tax=Thermocatellispora tengchongensis TaxID=1073253 RepID=A0A840PJZ5_9ACTN|nr:serine hydrolase domain-containing protein [Thermocatellispora tengchongensis]MBB5139236.1 CubicO group peptidase (beta-lactamase class C family) [Thermocatellispora tengchongensis]